jgi:hypothetical protein
LESSRELLHVVANLTGDHVGLGEIARGAKARLQVAEESRPIRCQDLNEDETIDGNRLFLLELCALAVLVGVGV